MHRAWMRLLGALSREGRDDDIANEIETHILMQTEEDLRRGMSPQEAGRAALLKFGGVDQTREACRDQRGFRLIDNLRLDIRAALRMLLRSPSISIPVILVLALGIGTATALYSLVYAMWLRPLPYADASRLVSVTTYFASHKTDALLSADYGTWQGTVTLGPLAAYSQGNATLVLPERTLEVGRAQISGNLLDVLRVHVVAGRNIQAADDAPGAARVVVLSNGLCLQLFGGDGNVFGRTMQIDGEACTIIGVLPPGFRMPDEKRVDLLTPLALHESWLRHGGGMKLLHGVARLQPGATLDQVRAELSTRLAGSRTQMPKLYGEDASLRIVPLHEYSVRDVRAAAIVLLGAVGSILLIASANVAGLLVARAAGRAHEMSTRAALGATPLQIMRHLLVEGLVLAAIGVAGGLALARALILLLEQTRPAMLVRVEGIGINGPVLAAALAVAMMCSLAFSLAPALPWHRLRIRRALVVGELALSLVLLVAAALLLENLARLGSVSAGFRTERLATATVSLKGTRFADSAGAFRRELHERLQGVPGIKCIGFADALPPTDASRITVFSRSDRALPEPFQGTDNVIVRLVDGRFFEAMGISLRHGRVFTEADQNGAGLLAMVNRTLASRYFAGEDPLGKEVDGFGVPWKTVVGVVADTLNDGLRNATRPEIYLPWTEGNTRGGGVTRNNGVNIVIRTSGDPATTISLLRANLRAMDRALLATVGTMDERWVDLQAGPRFHAAVFGGFAGLALVMACAGIHGVLSHIVILRRREIGIRQALGARPADIRRLILREALLLAAGGVVIGLAGALAGSRFLASLLFQVNPRDPLTLAGMAALLILLAICASAVPVLRASRQDPVETLRVE